MHTAQDFDSAENKIDFIIEVINEYKSSPEFLQMQEAEDYFLGDNTAIANRPKLKLTKIGREITFSKNITRSNFFARFVIQLNQFLLSNGAQLKKPEYKEALGSEFDNIFEEAGEMAQIHSVCYLYYNVDHVEKFEAVSNYGNDGFVPLFDERIGEIRIGIRFWQVEETRPMYIEVYELDGVTEYIKEGDKAPRISLEKRHYKQDYKIYPNNTLPEEIIGGENYDLFPIVPLYANRHHRSEFTEPLKSKIDLYDRIFSDFGDNLERTNDILWVISNFGGTTDEIRMMLAEIQELGATYSQSDGTGNSSIMPHTIEVPYEARRVALELLERAMYADFMAMNFSEISGGSLTNVAIDTAKFNLENKANRFEYQAFQTVKNLLLIAGIETEDIKFRRQTVSNRTENIGNVINEFNAGLLDRRTAIEKLDNVDIDEVPTILERLKAEEQAVRDNGDDLIFKAELQKALEEKMKELESGGE